MKDELRTVIIDGHERQAYFKDGVLTGYPIEDAMEILLLRIKKDESKNIRPSCKGFKRNKKSTL